MQITDKDTKLDNSIAATRNASNAALRAIDILLIIGMAGALASVILCSVEIARSGVGLAVFPFVRPDTSLALLLLALSLLAVRQGKYVLAYVVALPPFIYCDAIIVEHMWGLDLGVNRFVSFLSLNRLAPHVSHMSVYTSAGVWSATLSVIALSIGPRSRTWIGIALASACAAVFIGSAALLAYVAPDVAIQRITGFSSSRSLSALLLSVLAIVATASVWQAKQKEQVGALRVAFDTHAKRLSADVAAWLALIVGGTISIWLWYLTTVSVVATERKRFEGSANAVRASIVDRLDDYENLLLGGRGLFAASKSVERDEWRHYVSSLQAEQRYPGIQGLGFAAYVPFSGMADHVVGVQAEGYADYVVRPAGERDHYVPVVYLEPFSGRNLRAFGYDMFSEPTRRAAMETARDSGTPTLSGKITLVQETTEDVQAGFLLYVPIYRNGAVIETVEQRRDALIGFVYSPFRANDLFNSIADDNDAFNEQLSFVLYDGPQPNNDRRLYEYRRVGESAASVAPNYTPTFTTEKSIPFGGRAWTLRFATQPAFDAASASDEPLFVLFAGAVLSMFLFTSIRRVGQTRDRALALAGEITADLQRNAERLRVSEQRFELAVRGSNDGIWDWDILDNSVYYSTRLKQMWGYEENEIGHAYEEWSERLYPDDKDRVAGQIQHHLTTRAPFDIEMRMQLKNGEWRWFRARGQAVWNDVGTPTRMAGSLTDISEHKKVERMKNEFVATVSHELRTPLTAIRGSLGLISGGAMGNLPDKAGELVTLAARNSERLLHLINDILDIEKIESGKLEFKSERVLLAHLLRQAIDVNMPYAIQYGVQLQLRIEDESIAIVADSNRFLQVIDNLLSNAVKFSPKAGVVEIVAQRRDARVYIAVTDHGAGIPEEFRARIFQKFSQADSSSTRQKGGSGLGLSIAKSLVERCGGDLQFTTATGTGTTFYFELPIATATAQDSEAMSRG